MPQYEAETNVAGAVKAARDTPNNDRPVAHRASRTTRERELPAKGRSATEELRDLGLIVDVSDNTALSIKAELMIIDGQYWQSKGKYSDRNTRQHLFDAFDVLARHLIGAETPIQIISDMIPTMVLAFHQKEGWWPRGDLRNCLHGPIIEWTGKKLLMNTGTRPTISTAVVDHESDNPEATCCDSHEQKLTVLASFFGGATLPPESAFYSKIDIKHPVFYAWKRSDWRRCGRKHRMRIENAIKELPK